MFTVSRNIESKSTPSPFSSLFSLYLSTVFYTSFSHGSAAYIANHPHSCSKRGFRSFKNNFLCISLIFVAHIRLTKGISSEERGFTKLSFPSRTYPTFDSSLCPVCDVKKIEIPLNLLQLDFVFDDYPSY